MDILKIYIDIFPLRLLASLKVIARLYTKVTAKHTAVVNSRRAASRLLRARRDFPYLRKKLFAITFNKVNAKPINAVSLV